MSPIHSIHYARCDTRFPVQTVEEAREEHNRSEVRRGTVDDLMLQIAQ